MARPHSCFAKQILQVFVAQRPTLDPRVDWVASSASSDFEVTVHGLLFETDASQFLTSKNGYQIERHPRIGGIAKLLLFGWHLLLSLPALHLCLAFVLLAVLSPVLLVGLLISACVRFARTTVGWIFAALSAARSSIPAIGSPTRQIYQLIRWIWLEFLRARRSVLRTIVPKGDLGLISMLVGHMAPTTSAFLCAINKAGRKPDVVHCCDLDTLLVGVVAKRKYGCTVVYDAHEYWAYTDPDWSERTISFYRYLEQVLIRHADHVVTVNPLLADLMCRDYGLTCVHAVPNAAPWIEPDKTTAVAGTIMRLAAGRTSFIFQGGIAPERGLEDLLAAWTEVDSNKAALFIRGPESIFKDALVIQAEACGLLDKSVYFLDSISEDFLIDAAREADVGLIPYKNTLINHRLACPNKLSQYMHAGLMLISSDIPYVAGIIREARAGISFVSGSKGSLLAAVNAAISDKGMLAECKKNALAYARERFNWAKFYPILQQLYGSSRDMPVNGKSEDDLTAASPNNAVLSKAKKTILVLYFTRGVYPLRSTIHSHLYCWQKYSKHRIVYVNVALGFPERLLGRLGIDVIIFHTMFLSMRWTPAIFKRQVSNCYYLKGLSCTKIVIPQDEFLHTEMLNDFCNEFGVTHILTNSKEKDWHNIYGRIDRNRVKLRTVLTGYLDPDTVRTIDKLKARNNPRDIDVGYRAWKAEYWLGAHGMHKTRIAEIFQRAATRHELQSDISLEEKDVISGNAWFDYLLRCKSTIGVEGGASLLDRDGQVKDRVATYLRSNPAATFEETRSHCFPNEDGKLDLACVSPRHLEACATGTFQFLVEGAYNGILIPLRHYMPIKADYSNVDAALKIFSEPERMHQMTSTAYAEVVASGKWSYPAFVKEIEESIINSSRPGAGGKSSTTAQTVICWGLGVVDAVNWLFIRIEHWCVRSGLKTKLGRWLYARLIRLKGPY